MENIASNNIKAVIIHYLIFAGRSKKGIPEYKSKIRVFISLYRKPIFNWCQGKARSSSTVRPVSISVSLYAPTEAKPCVRHGSRHVPPR